MEKSKHYCQTNDRFGLTLIELIVVVLVLGVFVILFFPAVRTSRGAARRTQCKINLKQIGLAFHNYHDTHSYFPPAKTISEDGKDLHSWRTLLLPFLEHGPLYDQIDLSESWSSEANMFVGEPRIEGYRCPSVEIPHHHTHYKALVSAESFIRPASFRAVPEESTYSASSILVMEVDSNEHIPWMDPKDASLQALLEIGMAEELAHEGVFQVVMADGGVRALNSKSPIEELKGFVRCEDEVWETPEKNEITPGEEPLFDEDE